MGVASQRAWLPFLHVETKSGGRYAFRHGVKSGVPPLLDPKGGPKYKSSPPREIPIRTGVALIPPRRCELPRLCGRGSPVCRRAYGGNTSGIAPAQERVHPQAPPSFPPLFLPSPPAPGEGPTLLIVTEAPAAVQTAYKDLS